MDCRSYRRTKIDSDHYLVIVKIRAQISKAKEETKLRQKRFKVRELNDRTKTGRFSDNMEECMVRIVQIDTGSVDVNQRWNKIRD